MRVAVVSGSRADYGLLRPTLEALRDDPRFELSLLVSAMHLRRDHGATIEDIRADGFDVAREVAPGRPVREGGDLARNLGSATVAFTDALADLEPEILLVLGDRWEMLAAAQAATGLAVPIAHLHGGELSEGSLDDAMRHCITKLAHLHFVSTREYGERVCQLGEEPWRVHVVGAAAIESIRGLELLQREALAAELGVAELEPPVIALTLHPASISPERSGGEAQALVDAVQDVLDGRGTVVVTLPNDDPGNAAVRSRLEQWAERDGRVHAFASLGQVRYLSLLSQADAVVGNSSSGVIEAPAFGVPVVDVGDRQRGRIKPGNVLHAEAERDSIAGALRRALDPEFRASLADLDNPYDRGPLSLGLLEALASAPPADVLRRKRFHDLPDGRWRAGLRLGRE